MPPASGVTNPLRTEVQAHGRIRRWALIPDMGKYLRVGLKQMGKLCITGSLVAASGLESPRGMGNWSFTIIQTRICSISDLLTA
jgi:hypothetical protein